MSKLSFLAGAAVGYVLGARAGTQRYEQIKTQANKVWSSEPVQTKVSQATDAAKTKAAPFVADVVSDAAKATASKLRDVKDSVGGEKDEDLPPTLHRGTDGKLHPEHNFGPGPGKLP
ncbi:MAG: YtxH domain-containing protein [Tetrasphaera sp.]